MTQSRRTSYASAWHVVISLGVLNIVTPHVSDVSDVIVLTWSICLSMCDSVSQTDRHIMELAWRSGGRISRSSL